VKPSAASLAFALVLAASLMWQADELSLLIYTNVRLNQLIGLAGAALIVAYFVWISLKRRSVKIKGWRLELPGFRLSLAQMLIGAGDVCAGAGVLYVLLPGGHGIAFETFLAVYVFAVMLGVASHSPGGLGVFEATILEGVGGSESSVLASLLLFRGIYYAVPFIAAMAMLGGVEAVRRWRSLREAMLAPSEE